jgi:hypothetical protein
MLVVVVVVVVVVVMVVVVLTVVVVVVVLLVAYHFGTQRLNGGAIGLAGPTVLRGPLPEGLQSPRRLRHQFLHVCAPAHQRVRRQRLLGVRLSESFPPKTKQLRIVSRLRVHKRCTHQQLKRRLCAYQHLHGECGRKHAEVVK